MSFLTNPNDEPQPAEEESLPAEEDIDPADLEERLDEDPDEAKNFTDPDASPGAASGASDPA